MFCVEPVVSVSRACGVDVVHHTFENDGQGFETAVGVEVAVGIEVIGEMVGADVVEHDKRVQGAELTGWK